MAFSYFPLEPLRRTDQILLACQRTIRDRFWPCWWSQPLINGFRNQISLTWLCGISTTDFKSPCHWSNLVGKILALGGPTYTITHDTQFMGILSIWSASQPVIVILSTLSILSFHWKLFKINTMELVSHIIASGHSWRIHWPKDHRQNKWGNSFALLSVKYLFRHFSPPPLFFTKTLNKLTHIWFEAIVENPSTVPTRGSAAPSYLKHHCKNIAIVQIYFFKGIKLAVNLHLRKCSPISSPSHPILANPSLNPALLIYPKLVHLTSVHSPTL